MNQPLVHPADSEAEVSPVVSEAEVSPAILEAEISPVVHLEPTKEEGIPSLVSSPVSDALPMDQLSSGSHREIASASAPSGFQCSISSEVWVAEAMKLEDGWIAVKGKRSRPFAPPLDMNLRSRQGKFKSKVKS